MEKIARMTATVDDVLRKNYTNDQSQNPVKIRVTFNRKSKFYPVNHEGRPLLLAENDWDSIHKNKCPNRLKVAQSIIEKVKVSATSAVSRITRDGRPFTWERFEKEFIQGESKKGFLTLFADHLETLRAENRVGTYRSYLNAYNSFKRFRDERDLAPIDLTPDLLKKYEAYLIKNHCGKTTIGMYAAALKVIYNLAADKNPSLLETYPFARKQNDRNRYKIKRGSGHKGEALSVEQLQKFIALMPDPLSLEYEAKQYWLFSFHCQGMNLRDIFLLKYQDVKGESLRFIRQKTKDTENQETIMEIPLSDAIREIIVVMGSEDKKPANYLFPVIPVGLASTVKRRTDKIKTEAERIDEIIRQKIKRVNEGLKALCKASKDEDLKHLELTSYWARHSYANLLKSSGESVELIREMLGHSDIRTTESYLKRFDLAKRKRANEKITSLLKVG